MVHGENRAKLKAKLFGSALQDMTVSLSPYFKVKDVDKFKEIWESSYTANPVRGEKAAVRFGEGCVHYSFTFHTDPGTKAITAHCREAYRNSDYLIEHLDNVKGELTQTMESGAAEIERIEVHGPAPDVEKMKEALSDFGFDCEFYVAEWGFRCGTERTENDTACHLYPYFDLKDTTKFKQIWRDAYGATVNAVEEEKMVAYAFVFKDDGSMALCREAYEDASGVLNHLGNVDAALKAVLEPDVANLHRLELHGPASEIEKLKPALEPLGCKFFVSEWGYRNRATVID